MQIIKTELLRAELYVAIFVGPYVDTWSGDDREEILPNVEFSSMNQKWELY